MKKPILRMLSILLAAIFALQICAACADVQKPKRRLPPDTDINASDWTLETNKADPGATISKDPARGVKVRYACDPPEAGVIQGTATQYIRSGGYTEQVTAMPLYGYRFTGWSDGKTGRTRGGDSARAETVITALFEKVEVPVKLTVPSVYLTTDSGKAVKSKTYSGASMTVTGAEKEKYDLTDARLQIKGRGNSTWSTTYADKKLGDYRWTTTYKKYEQIDLIALYKAKNSYTLKFDEPVNLLGIGSGKNRDWILQGNKFDVTALRNKFMYLLAERMGTLTWVTNCAWVDLYVNGEYRGLYMIQEKPEAAKDRVPIDDSGTDPDKGYFIELNFRVDKESDKKEGLDWFYVPNFHQNDKNKREFEIKSEHSTEEECAFIRDYFIKVDDAIRSHDYEAVTSLVDIYSMIDIYLIEELGKDCDWGATSFYMYKERGGKLCFASPWDFDMCMGSYSSGIKITGLISNGTSGNEWFEELHDVPWFAEMVQARMNSLEDDLLECLVSLEKYALALQPYADKNNDLWNLYGVNYHYLISPQVAKLACTYDEHVAFIYDWVLYRWSILREFYPASGKAKFD